MADELRKRPETSILKRKVWNLSLRRNVSDTSVETIGDLGLNLLYEPPECLTDFVFVHGLRGGSRKTWSFSASQDHYWPKEWLPADADFQHVRIHSFGYNSDWLDRRENPLNVHDFGQSLIEEIQSNPHIRRNQNTPIVLIGHSMGGLVIKKACILSRENPSYKELGTRIHSIYFLATPHRGSDLTQTLHRLLRVTFSGDKPFVNNLKPGSEAINTLNDQFRHACRGIAIHSFTESIPSNWGIGSGLVVDKQSATLGYPDERVQALNADHRNICKFETPEDPNFRTLRNRLASTVDEIERSTPKSRHQAYREDMQALSSYLNVSRSPIDELSSLEDARLSGSCEWLTTKQAFLDWQSNKDSHRYFWLNGQPGTGKSVITAHVVGCLDQCNCSYYFFSRGDQTRSTLSGLLLSFAYQMAQRSRLIREKLLELSQDDSLLNKDDYRGIWRRLFLGGIFRTDFAHMHYWVIDALDECVDADEKSFDNFFSLLAKIDSSIPLKIFISSRTSADLERLFSTLPNFNVQISSEDSMQDIRMFVETYAKDLPAEDDEARQGLVETIVQKSAGCFLWTVLVMRQLQDIYTSQEIEAVLSEVPEEMQALYMRNLRLMATRTRTKKLAQTVLTWTLCATRSLNVEELKDAIRLDLKIVVVRDLERSISSLCGQFVFVDKHNRVQIVHETARTLLLDVGLESEFRVQMPSGNLQLGLTCLAYLTCEEMASPRKRRGSATVLSEQPKSALADYACTSFSDHLVRSTPASDPLFLALTKFLRTNVLVWIERMAKENNFYCPVRTAKHFKAYQARRAKHVAPLQDEVSGWAVDLPRLVTAFGPNLSINPVAIHELVPPLCPQSSSIYRQFGTPEIGLQLRGLSNLDWDDRICCYNYRDEEAESIACRDQWYAVGLSDGTVHVYWNFTCEEIALLRHGEPVTILGFGNLTKVLVSAGPTSIKLWDVSTGTQLLEIKTKDVRALGFDDEDKRLVAATRSKEVFEWSTADGALVSRHKWRHSPSRIISTVAISASYKLMAVAYPRMPLALWDLEAHQHIGFCTTGSDDGIDTFDYISSAVFNPAEALGLLAVAYGNGYVAIFDTCSRAMKCYAQIGAHRLAVSPDGRTLAGSDDYGGFQLFDFGTLKLLHRVTTSSGVIDALAFTGDGLRLIDRRGNQVNVWEPSALVRNWDYADDDRSELFGGTSSPVSNGMVLDPVEAFNHITAMKPAYMGSFAICGRDSGSLGILDLDSADLAYEELYKRKDKSSSFRTLDWNEAHHIIASVDIANHVKVMRLCKSTPNRVTVLEESLDDPLRNLRSRRPGKSTSNHVAVLDEIGDNPFSNLRPKAQYVSQLLISPDGGSLLISLVWTDLIWSLRSKLLVASRDSKKKGSWRWFTHPQNPTQLVLLEDFTLQSFSWEASGTFTKIGELLIHTEDRRFFELENMVIDTNGNRLFVKVGKNEKTWMRTGKDVSWCTVDLSDLGPEQCSLRLVPLFPIQGVKNNPDVDILLGTVPGVSGGRLLVFMNESGWICSVDLHTPAPHESFQRYFFVPFAWLNTRVTIIPMVTEKKDILFVRGNEVAIIKNGLDAGEVVLIR